MLLKLIRFAVAWLVTIVPPLRLIWTKLFVAPEVVPFVMPPEAVRMVPPVSRLSTLVMLSRAALSPRLRRIVDPVAAMKSALPRTFTTEVDPTSLTPMAKFVPEL